MHLQAVTAALVAALIGACQAPQPDGEPAPSAPEADVSETVSDSLRLRLELPESVAPGEAVAMTVRVENVAEHPIDLYLTGRPIAFDLIVTDAEGEVVWRRLEDQVIAAILGIHTLGPGESLELADTWDQKTGDGEPVPPGVYAVRGELLTEGEPLVTPAATLHIHPDS